MWSKWNLVNLLLLLIASMIYTTTLINKHSHGFQVIDEYLPNIPNHLNITYKTNPKVAYNVRHSTLLEWQERLSMSLSILKFQKVVEIIHSSYLFQRTWQTYTRYHFPPWYYYHGLISRDYPSFKYLILIH